MTERKPIRIENVQRCIETLTRTIRKVEMLKCDLSIMEEELILQHRRTEDAITDLRRAVNERYIVGEAI